MQSAFEQTSNEKEKIYFAETIQYNSKVKISYHFFVNKNIRMITFVCIISLFTLSTFILRSLFYLKKKKQKIIISDPYVN